MGLKIFEVDNSFNSYHTAVFYLFWQARSVKTGTSLAVQCLRLHSSNAGDESLIPGQRTKIPHTMGNGQKKERKKNVKSG